MTATFEPLASTSSLVLSVPVTTTIHRSSAPSIQSIDVSRAGRQREIEEANGKLMLRLSEIYAGGRGTHSVTGDRNGHTPGAIATNQRHQHHQVGARPSVARLSSPTAEHHHTSAAMTMGNTSASTHTIGRAPGRSSSLNVMTRKREAERIAAANAALASHIEAVHARPGPMVKEMTRTAPSPIAVARTSHTGSGSQQRHGREPARSFRSASASASGRSRGTAASRSNNDDGPLYYYGYMPNRGLDGFALPVGMDRLDGSGSGGSGRQGLSQSQKLHVLQHTGRGGIIAGSSDSNYIQYDYAERAVNSDEVNGDTKADDAYADEDVDGLDAAYRDQYESMSHIARSASVAGMPMRQLPDHLQALLAAQQHVDQNQQQQQQRAGMQMMNASASMPMLPYAVVVSSSSSSPLLSASLAGLAAGRMKDRSKAMGISKSAPSSPSPSAPPAPKLQHGYSNSRPAIGVITGTNDRVLPPPGPIHSPPIAKTLYHQQQQHAQDPRAPFPNTIDGSSGPNSNARSMVDLGGNSHVDKQQKQQLKQRRRTGAGVYRSSSLADLDAAYTRFTAVTGASPVLGRDMKPSIIQDLLAKAPRNGMRHETNTSSASLGAAASTSSSSAAVFQRMRRLSAAGDLSVSMVNGLGGIVDGDSYTGGGGGGGDGDEESARASTINLAASTPASSAAALVVDADPRFPHQNHHNHPFEHGRVDPSYQHPLAAAVLGRSGALRRAHELMEMSQHDSGYSRGQHAIGCKGLSTATLMSASRVRRGSRQQGVDADEEHALAHARAVQTNNIKVSRPEFQLPTSSGLWPDQSRTGPRSEMAQAARENARVFLSSASSKAMMMTTPISASMGHLPAAYQQYHHHQNSVSGADDGSHHSSRNGNSATGTTLKRPSPIALAAAREPIMVFSATRQGTYMRLAQKTRVGETHHHNGRRGSEHNTAVVGSRGDGINAVRAAAYTNEGYATVIANNSSNNVNSNEGMPLGWPFACGSLSPQQHAVRNCRSSARSRGSAATIGTAEAGDGGDSVDGSHFSHQQLLASGDLEWGQTQQALGTAGHGGTEDVLAIASMMNAKTPKHNSHQQQQKQHPSYSYGALEAGSGAGDGDGYDNDDDGDWSNEQPPSSSHEVEEARQQPLVQPSPTPTVPGPAAGEAKEGDDDDADDDAAGNDDSYAAATAAVIDAGTTNQQGEDYHLAAAQPVVLGYELKARSSARQPTAPVSVDRNLDDATSTDGLTPALSVKVDAADSSITFNSASATPKQQPHHGKTISSVGMAISYSGRSEDTTSTNAPAVLVSSSSRAKVEVEEDGDGAKGQDAKAAHHTYSLSQDVTEGSGSSKEGSSSIVYADATEAVAAVDGTAGDHEDGSDTHNVGSNPVTAAPESGVGDIPSPSRSSSAHQGYDDGATAAADLSAGDGDADQLLGHAHTHKIKQGHDDDGAEEGVTGPGHGIINESQADFQHQAREHVHKQQLAKQNQEEETNADAREEDDETEDHTRQATDGQSILADDGSSRSSTATNATVDHAHSVQNGHGYHVSAVTAEDGGAPLETTVATPDAETTTVDPSAGSIAPENAPAIPTAADAIANIMGGRACGPSLSVPPSSPSPSTSVATSASPITGATSGRSLAVAAPATPVISTTNRSSCSAISGVSRTDDGALVCNGVVIPALNLEPARVPSPILKRTITDDGHVDTGPEGLPLCDLDEESAEDVGKILHTKSSKGSSSNGAGKIRGGATTASIASTTSMGQSRRHLASGVPAAGVTGAHSTTTGSRPTSTHGKTASASNSTIRKSVSSKVPATQMSAARSTAGPVAPASSVTSLERAKSTSSLAKAQ